MILTYDEALERSTNKEWFKSVYKKEDVIFDEEVKDVNELAKKAGPKALKAYFEIDDDMFLQKEYKEDLIAFLYDVIDGVEKI